MRSGLNVPTPAIPIPDLAVPYAAPMPVASLVSVLLPTHKIASVTYIQISSNQPATTSVSCFFCIYIHGYNSRRRQYRPILIVNNSLVARTTWGFTIPKKGANFGASSFSAMLTRMTPSLDEVLGRDSNVRSRALTKTTGTLCYRRYHGKHQV